MQPIFENQSRKLIDALHETKKEMKENQERLIRGFEWLGESLLSLKDPEAEVFEVGHAFAARNSIAESKVESAARILGFNNSPHYQDLSNKLWKLIGKKSVSGYNELKLYENPAFVTPDEEAFLRMRVTRNRNAEPITYTQMFEDVCSYVQNLSFMKNQTESVVKRLVFENLFREGCIRNDIREMSSANICRLVGDCLWEQVKELDINKAIILTEAIVSSDVASTAQSQGADKETDKKYDFSPEEIQRLKDIFASGPLRYKPTVDNRLLRLSVIRYGKGGKHVEPVEGSWSDTYLDSGLLSSAEGPKKQTTQESLSIQPGQTGFVNIQCETPDEVDLVAEAVKEDFEVYVDDQNPLILKVRVYQTPNAEDVIYSLLKVAGLAGDIEDKDPEPETFDSEELESITEAEEEEIIHLEDHPTEYLNKMIQLKNTDGEVESESTYGEFLKDNDDEMDGIPKELAFLKPGEVRKVGGGAAPEFVLSMQSRSDVWESENSKLTDADIALMAEEIVQYLKEPTAEILRTRSCSGVSVAELIEGRLGRRAYDNTPSSSERGKCHRRGRNRSKDFRLKKQIQTLLDQDADTNEAISKKE